MFSCPIKTQSTLLLPVEHTGQIAHTETRKANAQITQIQVQNYKIHVVYTSLIHTSHTKQTVLDLFVVCSNHAPLHYSAQESKNNLQFMIPTYLWPWNKVKVIKPSSNCKTPRNVIIRKVWKISHKVFARKPTWKFLSNQKTCQLSLFSMFKCEK